MPISKTLDWYNRLKKGRKSIYKDSKNGRSQQTNSNEGAKTIYKKKSIYL